MFLFKKVVPAIALTVALSTNVSAGCKPVNVNTANVTTLKDSLTGIGTKKAARIVEERTTNGDFKSLIGFQQRVKGVGKKTMEKNNGCVLLEDAKADGTTKAEASDDLANQTTN